MKRVLATCALLFATGAVGAQATLEDFAYAYEIDTRGPAGIYALTLPPAVYSRSYTPDLGDIAVFNAAGERVPHALQKPPPEPAAVEQPVGLAYFPLYENESELPEQLTIELLADFKSASIALEKKTRPEDGAIVAYIVDTGEPEKDRTGIIEALLFDWSNEGESFITHIDIESSSDLAKWHSVRYQAALVRLSYGGNRLEQNRVELMSPAERYLKIHWPAGRDGARIESMRAVFAQDAAPVRRQWKNIAGHRVGDDDNPAFEYEIPGRLPVSEVNLGLTKPNSLLQGAIHSRSDPEQPWLPRREGLFYRVWVDEIELSNPGTLMRPTTDQFWRVTFDPDQSNLGDDVPWLQVGWIAHRLVFLAHGDGPYTLAFGSARAHIRQAAVGQLIDELNEAMDTLPLGEAKTGRVVQAGGGDALVPRPPPVPWRNLVLWGTLVFAVLVLGFLTWRLYKQLYQSPR